jgi:hypothetical protein
MRQAADARAIIPMAEAPPPRGDGLYGAKFPGKPLNMVILGDSTGAGYGVHRPRETPGALLATGVSRRLRRPVRLHRLAVVGSMSSGLPYQVDAALEYDAEIAVILVGGNDVTHLLGAARPPSAISATPSAGCARSAAGWSSAPAPTSARSSRSSRRCAGWPAGGAGSWPAAQTVAVVEAGGRTVSIGDCSGPAFEGRPGPDVRLGPLPPPRSRDMPGPAAVMMPTLMATSAEDDRAPARRPRTGCATCQGGPGGGPRGRAPRSARPRSAARARSGRALGQLRRHPWFGEPRFWFGTGRSRAAGGVRQRRLRPERSR